MSLLDDLKALGEDGIAELRALLVPAESDAAEEPVEDAPAETDDARVQLEATISALTAERDAALRDNAILREVASHYVPKGVDLAKQVGFAAAEGEVKDGKWEGEVR